MMNRIDMTFALMLVAIVLFWLAVGRERQFCTGLWYPASHTCAPFSELR